MKDPTQRWVFTWWANHFFEILNIGGIYIGNQWHSNPDLWNGYDWFVNELLPQSPEDMMLFCQSKFRPEVFFLALLGKYDVIEHLTKREIGRL